MREADGKMQRLCLVLYNPLAGRDHHPKRYCDVVFERVCWFLARRITWGLRREPLPLGAPEGKARWKARTGRAGVVADKLTGGRHESMMGSINDPEDGKAVAGTLFSSVVVYAVSWSMVATGGRGGGADVGIGVLGVLFRTGVVEFEAKGGAVRVMTYP
jgi:hypothetical protein